MSTFNSPSDAVPLTKVRAADINNLDAATAAAFALLPDETKIKLGTVQFAVDTGVANAYLVALTHTPAGYADGMGIVMRPINANSGASTINVNGLGVKSIRREDSTALTTGDIRVGAPVLLYYSTATGFFHTVGGLGVAAAAAASAAAAAASAAASEVSNVASAASAAASAAFYDSFDDRYLGAKAADPTLDNDGNALITGAIYWNTTVGAMKAYTGAAWVVPDTGTYLLLAGGTMTGAVNTANGTDIASAATVNLTTATGNRVHITGNTTITAVTLARGPRTVIFDGALTLTHHATNNNLPGAANITTMAGDRAIYESDGTTVYCIAYMRADGTGVVTPVATQAEQETATSTSAYVTPGRQHFHPSAAKVWLTCGISGNILASYNVTSITDTGPGQVTVTIGTDFSSANYAALGSINATDLTLNVAASAAGTLVAVSRNLSGATTDPGQWSFAAFGDQ